MSITRAGERRDRKVSIFEARSTKIVSAKLLVSTLVTSRPGTTLSERFWTGCILLAIFLLLIAEISFIQIMISAMIDCVSLAKKVCRNILNSVVSCTLVCLADFILSVSTRDIDLNLCSNYNRLTESFNLPRAWLSHLQSYWGHIYSSLSLIFHVDEPTIWKTWKGPSIRPISSSSSCSCQLVVSEELALNDYGS